jgi:23S rRNA-/tRNA-specific pseudouridylate synthase
MLHATALRFTHPSSGEEMGFEVPIPDDMNQIVGRCS